MTFSQPVFVCTFIALTIIPVKYAIALFFIVLPAAFIAVTAGVIISPLAIHIAIFPFALITVTATPVKGSTAFFFSIDPIPLVTIAIGIQINAMTFSQPVFVCTFIAVTAGVIISPLAIHIAIFPFALITLTIIPAKNSMTVFFTVFHCTCVFSIRISLFYNGVRTLFLPFFKIFSRYRTYGTIFNKIFPFVKSTLGTFIFTLFLSRTHRTNPHFFPSFDFQNRLFHEIIFPFTHLESTIRPI